MVLDADQVQPRPLRSPHQTLNSLRRVGKRLREDAELQRSSVIWHNSLLVGVGILGITLFERPCRGDARVRYVLGSNGHPSGAGSLILCSTPQTCGSDSRGKITRLPLVADRYIPNTISTALRASSPGMGGSCPSRSAAKISVNCRRCAAPRGSF